MDIKRQCKECGKEFFAHKQSSFYCCSQCQKKAVRKAAKKAEETTIEVENEETSEVLKNAPLFLSPNKLARLFDLSRATIYRYMANGTIRALQLKRTTIIRMKDLDNVFDEMPSYKKRSRIIRQESSYYSMREIIEKYHISKKAVLRRCEQYDIPKVYKGRNTFFSKTAIDMKFADLLEEINMELYYTTEELMEKFSMTRNAVINFVARHKVPRVTRLKNAYYSKVYIDAIKVKPDGLDPEYYTFAEIEDKYKLTRDQIKYYLRSSAIRTEKRGKFTMIYRLDFDEAVKQRIDPGQAVSLPTAKIDEEALSSQSTEVSKEGYYTSKAIAHRYKFSVSGVQNLMLEHDIPRIYVNHTYYYEQEAVDDLFAEKEGYAGIKEWLSIEQLQRLYGTNKDSLRGFIRTHQIPNKIFRGVTVFSKDHFEFAKGLVFEGRENYYSSAEVMEKYCISIDLLCYYAKQKGFQKTKCGKYTYYLKEDVDIAMVERSADAVALEQKREEQRQYEEDLATGIVKKYSAQPIPSPEGYYSVAEVCEKYHITYDILKNVVKKHGIPSIKEKRFSFFPQEPLDKILSERNVEIDRNEWLTGEEVDDLYEFKTVASRAAFLTRHAIPSTMSCNKTFYSKKALDQAKLHTFAGREDYYSKDEAMSKFGMSGDNLFHFAKRNKISTTRQGRAVFYLRADMDKAMAERMARMDKAVPAGYYSIDQISANCCIPHKQVQHTANAHKIPFIVVRGVTYYDKAASDRVFSQEQQQYEVIDWLSAEEVDERYGFPAPQHRYSFIKTHQIPFIVKDDKKYYSKQHLDEAKYHSFEGREQYYTIKEITEKYSIEKKTADYLTRHYKVRKKSHGKLNFYLIEDVEKVMAEWTNDNK